MSKFVSCQEAVDQGSRDTTLCYLGIVFDCLTLYCTPKLNVIFTVHSNLRRRKNQGQIGKVLVYLHGRPKGQLHTFGKNQKESSWKNMLSKIPRSDKLIIILFSF